MLSTSIYLDLLFVIVTALTFYYFSAATNFSKKVFLIGLSWLAIQALLGAYGVYNEAESFPPKAVFMILPPSLAIVLIFLIKGGRAFIDSLNLKYLTLIHSVRFFVEVVLFSLFTYKLIPEVMTFEGKNFDIITGITAPLMYYLFLKQKIGRTGLLIWNLICLSLVLNVAIHGLFAAPTAMQKIAFDQPNVAVLYFPYVWLPSFIVPLVIFSHLAAIRILIRDIK